MNKTHLAFKIAKENSISLALADSILNTMFAVIKAEVGRGEDVRLLGFGTFVKAKRKSRSGRNPQTGEKMQIPGYSYPKFRAGAEFKETCKETYDK